MKKLIDIIESHKTVNSAKHNNQYGHIVKFKNNEGEFFISMYNPSAFEWNMAIARATTKDLPVEIEYDDEFYIKALALA